MLAPALPLFGPPGVGVSGDSARVAPLGPHRDRFFSRSFWTRHLPKDPAARAALVYQHPTLPDANSANWVANICQQMGFDPATPQTQATPNYLGTPVPGKATLRREGEPLYIVPDDQPLTPVLNEDVTMPPQTARFNAVVERLGGLPIPADAMPGNSADRFLGVYQPDTGLYAHLYAAGVTAANQATVTLTAAGVGSFNLRIEYGDHVTFPNVYTTVAPISSTASAAEVKAAVDNSRTSTGAKFPTGQSLVNCQAADGPLGTAPVVLTFAFAMVLKPVTTTVLDATAAVTVAHRPQGRVDRCRFGSIVRDTATHYGRSQNDVDPDGFVWEDAAWGGTATRIIQFAGMPSYDEAATAQAAGTGVGHAVPMVVASAQYSPLAYVQPANHGDGNYQGAQRAPEGVRIAFPPDVDLSYIEGTYPEIMWLARTLRDDGAVTYDKTAVGCQIIFRRASWAGQDFNPWRDLLPQYVTSPGGAAHTYMRVLPWHKAQIIDPAFSA